MNSPHLVTHAEGLCDYGIAVSISAVGGNHTAVITRSTSTSVTPPPTFLVRMAMRMSRAKWYSFLRRVFHYQNGSGSNLGPNPFDSGAWMVMELVILVTQMVIIGYTLAVSKEEKPIWPMRVWVSAYGLGCFLNLLLLFWRFWVFHRSGGEVISHSDTEQRSNEEPRSLQLMNKFRTCIELFFAIWFVMGNVWTFDSRLGSFRRSPKLFALCISLLVWNAISYSFPFILFVLLCCCVPLISSLIGYNMNMGSIERGASDEQLSKLPSWKYKQVEEDLELGKAGLDGDNIECCICLAKYKDKDEIRELTCSHIFHLKCVDQWLKIVSCCPLCKQQI